MFAEFKNAVPLHRFEKEGVRAFSSAGQSIFLTSEGRGSNPSTPTLKTTHFRSLTRAFSQLFRASSYKQRVGGSNPSTPPKNRSIRKKFVRLFYFFLFIQTFSILLLITQEKEFLCS